MKLMLLATFMAGCITGHSCATFTPRAHAHGASGDTDSHAHVAHHLSEINTTLKKIERKIK
jgi:hypothetical protein